MAAAFCSEKIREARADVVSGIKTSLSCSLVECVVLLFDLPSKGFSLWLSFGKLVN